MSTQDRGSPPTPMELCGRIAALELSHGDMASVLGTLSVLAPDALDKALDALVLERLGDQP